MQVTNYNMVFGIIGVWLLILFWAMIFAIAYGIYTKQYVKIALVVLLGAAGYYMTQFAQIKDEAGADKRLLVLCIAAVLLTVLMVIVALRMRQWNKSHVTNISVKAAIDQLTDGICCYDADGRIWMKNQQMDKICKESTGELLINGHILKEYIKENAVKAGGNLERIAGKYCLHLKDGKTFAMSFEKIQVFEKKLNLVIASDITEEYAKTMDLMAGKKKVQELNQNLRRYNREIVSVLSSRENLNAKIKIHDELGLNLLQIKKYILEGGTKEDKEVIIQSLQNNVRFLLQEIKPVVVDEMQVLLKTADDLGIRVNIVGEMPNGGHFQEVFKNALHECLTNTLRHAGGNELTAVIEENAREIEVKFTNSGVKPTGPIHEKGGLKSLRRLVEAQNGQMEISIEDGFLLTITVPKE